jgi:antitoxin (DNA-binding transcriptional repressor) of toxin-antitoxin stability system
MESLITLKDLQLNIDKYATEVKAGKSFIVLKQSKPLFKITPLNEDGNWEEAVNFTKIKNCGVNIDELLAVL